MSGRVEEEDMDRGKERICFRGKKREQATVEGSVSGPVREWGKGERREDAGW